MLVKKQKTANKIKKVANAKDFSERFDANESEGNLVSKMSKQQQLQQIQKQKKEMLDGVGSDLTGKVNKKPD